MEIKRSIDIENFIWQKLILGLDKKRQGIHASDLIYPKKAYWQRISPLPPTREEVMYWLSGQSHERIFLHISDLKHGGARQWEGIWFSPDIMFDFPVELKTTRRGYVVKEGEEAEKYKHYLKQLSYYCAMTNSTKGWLVVWYLTMITNNQNTAPDLFAYEVNYTEKELENIRQDLLCLKNNLITAIDKRNPDSLPDCDAFLCYETINVMTDKPVCFTCNKEFQTDWGINKHIESNSGKGHHVRYAIYERHKKPKCKYAQFCKPEIVEGYKEALEKGIFDEKEGDF